MASCLGCGESLSVDEDEAAWEEHIVKVERGALGASRKYFCSGECFVARERST
jgi:hypothetical protein